ncbi:MAG TPA: hypothetical protein VKU86_01315 [Acidimicrobiales bacterium]|nr:hypothetical protein [Acidimicrobiales bacterium]
MTAALIDLDHVGHYLHWGFIQLSVANAVIIGLMVVIFVVAIALPFRAGHRARRGGR